jgi:hypothetical protein
MPAVEEEVEEEKGNHVNSWFRRNTQEWSRYRETGGELHIGIVKIIHYFMPLVHQRLVTGRSYSIRVWYG